MIAAAAGAAGITNPDTLKQFELEVTMVVKVWAYSPDDAQGLAWSRQAWDDSFVVGTTPVVATGVVEG